MSKKRGLSAEEKRHRLLELFYEKKEFFQLKELEKIAPKEKGITSMSVKDVLQSLVDDALVDTDRIGTSNYFWSFPSKAANNRKRKMEELTASLAEAKKKRDSLQEEIRLAKLKRSGDDDREDILKELTAMKELQAKQLKQLEEYKICDPERVAKMEETSKMAVVAANRWTDNVFSVKSWCKSKFSFDEATIDKQFGIPEDFDYID